MGKRLSQLNQVDRIEKEDYLLVDGEEYLESKKIALKDIDISNFNTENFYKEIDGNFVKKENGKGLSSNDFTDTDKNKLDASQEELISGRNIKTINGESILGEGNIEIQSVIDQTYNPESKNPQSGKAVAIALQQKISMWQPNTEYKVDDVVIGDISFDGFYYFQAILFCKRNHTSENELNEDKRLNLYEDVRSGMWGVKPFISREAECDKEGNSIHETYATKDELAEAIGEALEGDY